MFFYSLCFASFSSASIDRPDSTHFLMGLDARSPRDPLTLAIRALDSGALNQSRNRNTSNTVLTPCIRLDVLSPTNSIPAPLIGIGRPESRFCPKHPLHHSRGPDVNHLRASPQIPAKFYPRNYPATGEWFTIEPAEIIRRQTREQILERLGQSNGPQARQWV